MSVKSKILILAIFALSQPAFAQWDETPSDKPVSEDEFKIDNARVTEHEIQQEVKYVPGPVTAKDLNLDSERLQPRRSSLSAAERLKIAEKRIATRDSHRKHTKPHQARHHKSTGKKMIASHKQKKTSKNRSIASVHSKNHKSKTVKKHYSRVHSTHSSSRTIPA